MYEITHYLYTLKNCGGCENARRILNEKNIAYIEIPIDNPAVELATKVLFRDTVYAPYLFHPTEGVYVFSVNDILKVKV